jgi:hypothetical protein
MKVRGGWRRVPRSAVLAAAHSECEARGWPWREPVLVTRELFHYRVWTNADVRDDNPWLVYSRNLRLKSAGWAGRSKR